MTSSTQPNKNTWALLALTRFVLATIVMCGHIGDYNGQDDLLARGKAFGGFAAVAAFLIISGYSIRASVERDQTNFFRRRWYRIMPVYLAAFVIATLPWILFGPAVNARGVLTEAPSPSHELPALLMNVFPLQCLSRALKFPTIGQAWTLSCEVFFYLTAILLTKTSSVVRNRILLFSLFTYILHIALRPEVDFYQDSYGVAAICLYWVWLFGWQLHEIPTSERRTALFVACGALIAIDPQQNSVLAVVTVLLVRYALQFGEVVSLSPRLVKVFNWLGDISYPLYLVHVAIFDILGAAWPVHRFMALDSFVFFGAAYATAIILLYVVDYPVRHWQKHIEHNKNSQSQLPDPAEALQGRTP